MFQEYGHKIKSIEDLIDVIGERPRDRSVAMCHGAFDIVHPGHIRHLIYASSQADILIASVTADEFSIKGDDRPYVPEELRAANIAALEMVDYVVIDRHETPLTNIATLKPDFFVKGFEYSADGIHPRSREEMELVSSYGGKFLFSPGDVVYSSTRLLVQHRPDITIEKLLALLSAEGVTEDMLRSTVRAMSGTKVHVVGDTIVDKYTYCTLLGPSGKTPTFSVKPDRSDIYVGGAGAVARHMRALGADVTFTTLVGTDDLASMVIQDLESVGISVNVVRDPSRPTTLKQRFWADGYKLLQVDDLDNSPITERLVKEVGQYVSGATADVVVFSDFRHGLFHGESVEPIVASIPQGALKVADSQVSNRWGNITDFKGFDLITPNEREARFAVRDQDSGIRSLAQHVLERAEARHLILTLGDRGVLAYRESGDGPRSFFSLDSFASAVVDAVGAGDALLSASALALSHSGNLVEASVIGSLAAAVACENDGNLPVDQNSIIERLDDLFGSVRG